MGSQFSEIVKREHGSDNWVIARRTANIVRRYGDDVVALSKKEYKRLEAMLEYETAGQHPACELIDKLVQENYPAVGFIRALRADGYQIEKVYGE